MSKLQPSQIGSLVKSFISIAEEMVADQGQGPKFPDTLARFFDALLDVFTADGEVEVRFGDDHIFVNDRKIRLSGKAGVRLNALLAITRQANWLGFRCDEIPNEDQITAVFSRFGRPELPGSHPNLLQRIAPFRWLHSSSETAAADQAPGLGGLGEDAPEHSMVRQLQVDEIRQALGEEDSSDLEELTFVYARTVYFVDRFMTTIEPGGPRVPLDEASRILCDLVDLWLRAPKAVLAMAMARPQIGNYDAFHQANTTLLCLALGGSLGLRRQLMFELGLAALLHQVGVVDMPQRIRSARVLKKEERDVLATLPRHSIRRLLQIHGPDLSAMRRMNAIIAMKEPMARRGQGKDGKANWVPTTPSPPLMARIIAVAARYDALTSEREFRPAMDSKPAFLLMMRMGAQLDLRLVRLLATLHRIQL